MESDLSILAAGIASEDTRGEWGSNAVQQGSFRVTNVQIALGSDLSGTAREVKVILPFVFFPVM